MNLRLLPLFFSGAVCIMLADESFLNMGPTIPGEATTKGFEKQIKVLGFSYDGSTLQKVQGFNTMIFSKSFDSASPKLLDSAVKGTRLPEVIFTLTRPTGFGTETYARVIMKDVTVVAIKIDGDDNGSPSEEITLQYDRADWCQKPQLNGPEVCTTIAPK